MHILKIIHGYPPLYNAGSEVYSQSICNELSKNNKISLFTREENIYRATFEIRKEETRSNFQRYIVNMARGKDGYRHQVLDERFGRLLKEIKPDVAHIGHLNHLSTGLVGELKKQRIPIVFTLHDFWLMCPRGQFMQRNFGPQSSYQLCSGQADKKCAESCYKMYFSGHEKDAEKELTYWTNWIATRMETTRTLVELVDLFHAPSRYLAQRFIDDFGIPPAKIAYLDYGFPTHYLNPNPKKAGQPFTFGYIGTHIPAKGINQLIEAFGQVKGRVKLKIWGRNRGQDTFFLKEIAKQSPNPIEFLAEYQNETIATEVFSQVDGIVVPSIWGENSPLVIHEAQACQVPVITADFGGMSEYVAHEVNGLLFNHREVQSLQVQLQRAADEAAWFRTLGKRGYLFSENGAVPSVEEHCQQLLNLYQKTSKNYDYA